MRVEIPDITDAIRSLDQPVVKLVNLFLLQMHCVKAENASLPGWGPDLPEQLYPALINRFKILCNLNPVLFTQPTSGRFLVKIADGLFVVAVQFHDLASPRRIDVTLRAATQVDIAAFEH